MKTATELEITAGQHSSIQTYTGFPAYRVTVEQYHPFWTAHDTSGVGPHNLFDVLAIPDYLIRAYIYGSNLVIQRLPSEHDENTSWEEIYNDNLLVQPIAPSIAYDNDTLRVFYVEDGGTLKYIQTGDVSNWESEETVGTLDDIKHIAASDPSTVHLIERGETTNNNSRFHVYTYGGTWEIDSSDIYWPYPMNSFDAAKVGDKTILVFSSMLPADVGIRVTGATTQNVAYVSTGVSSIQYRNGHWSDLYPIKWIDQLDASNARTYPKLTNVGDFLVCSVYALTDKYNPHRSLAYYLSKDGENWQYEELVPWSDATTGAIVALDGYVYAVGSLSCKRSYATSFFGLPPNPAILLDLTPYVIACDNNAYSLEWTGNNWYNNSILAQDRTFHVKLYSGYIIDGSPVLILSETSVVDSVSYKKVIDDKGYQHTVSIKTRPLDAYLGDRVVSDTVVDRPDMGKGYDSFIDQTDTGFGGLAHTAIVKGNWRAENGVLTLLSSNMDGIAWGTFILNTYSGQLRATVGWTDSGNGEWSGLVFRGYDSFNYFLVRYNTDTDKIEIVKVNANEKIVLASSNTLNLSETEIALWVVFNMGKVIVYRKINNVWTEAVSHVIAGSTTVVGNTLNVPIRGYMGYGGYAYSAGDSWEAVDPETINIWVTEMPTYTEPYEGYGEESGGTGGGAPALITVGFTEDNWMSDPENCDFDGAMYLLRTDNIVAENVVWEPFLNGLPSSYSSVPGMFRIGHVKIDPTNRDRAVLSTMDGFYENTSWKTGGPWRLLKSLSSICSAIGKTYDENDTHIVSFDLSPHVPGDIVFIVDCCGQKVAKLSANGSVTGGATLYVYDTDYTSPKKCGALGGGGGVTEAYSLWNWWKDDPEYGPYGPNGLFPLATYVNDTPEITWSLADPGYWCLSTLDLWIQISPSVKKLFTAIWYTNTFSGEIQATVYEPQAEDFSLYSLYRRLIRKAAVIPSKKLNGESNTTHTIYKPHLYGYVKSRDIPGSGWQSVGTTFTAKYLASDPNYPRQLWAAGNNGLSMYLDTSGHWNNMDETIPDSMTEIADRLYISGDGRTKILTSPISAWYEVTQFNLIWGYIRNIYTTGRDATEIRDFTGNLWDYGFGNYKNDPEGEINEKAYIHSVGLL